MTDEHEIMEQTINEISGMMRIEGTLQERCVKIRQVFKAVMGVMPKVAANMDELMRKNSEDV